MNLRSYGPGQFDLHLDQFVYEITLHGMCDECGSVDTIGWHAVVYAPFNFGDYGIENDLNAEELAFLASHTGCIIRQDSNGFVDIDYYESSEELESDWQAIEDYESEFFEDCDECP